MNFFFDRNISHVLVKMIDVFDRDNTVRHHDDRFSHKTKDPEWIEALGNDSETWVIVSGDYRILRREKELQTLRSTDATFFAMTKGWMNQMFDEQAWKLVKIWPKITTEAERLRSPSIFEVPLNANKITKLGTTKHYKR